MKITIVLRTYNRPQFLREALSSISNQYHTDWEVLIFDDMGSIENFEIYSKFKAYHTENRVVYVTSTSQYEFFKKSWNDGVHLSTGDICIRLDDDDLLLPYTLEYISNLYRDNTDLDFTYGSAKFFREDGTLDGGIDGRTPFESTTKNNWGPYTIPNNAPWEQPYCWFENWYSEPTPFTSIIHASRFNVLCIYHLYTFRINRVKEVIDKINISSNLCDDLEFYGQLDYMGLRQAAIKDTLLLCRIHTEDRVSDLTKKSEGGLDWRGEIERVRCKIDRCRENGFVSKVVLVDTKNTIAEFDDTIAADWISRIQYDSKKY
jgi:glycosyltransferase involved in cell wall biosynthesis